MDRGTPDSLESRYYTLYNLMNSTDPPTKVNPLSRWSFASSERANQVLLPAEILVLVQIQERLG
jgi:hypothetical protein